MARYRGRHRTPSSTGRKIARTAVAGAVMGAPLLIAVPAANAAPDTTWDKVAQCESTGRWDINTGNGYSGGLQFSPTTWTAFGGGEFATSAFKATRAQQIVVAERVLAKQGWGAWPVCSVKAGATGQGVTPRTAPAQAPAAPVTAVLLSGPTGGYVVKAGDTLSAIASKNGVAGGWQALVQKNPALAGNPNKIMPGQHITL